MDGVFCGRNGKTSPNAFFGFIDGIPVDALAAWTLLVLLLIPIIGQNKKAAETRLMKISNGMLQVTLPKPISANV